MQANPPFVPAVISAMAVHMQNLLDAAAKRNKRLSFIVVVPRWESKPCWQQLRDCKYTDTEIVIGNREHE